MPPKRPTMTIVMNNTAIIELANVMASHHEHQRGSRELLRCKIRREREARDKMRRDVQLNEHVTKKLGNFREHHVLATGNASDAMSWKNIEERGDLDKRLRHYRQTEQCEVVDVCEAFRTGQLLSPRNPSSAATLPAIAKRRRSVAKLGRSARGQAQRSTADIAKGSPRGQGGSVPKTMVTERAIQQAEADFLMLAYGRTHILRETLEDYGAEHVGDLGSRRVIFIEFLEYMRLNNITELPFVAFLRVVYPTWPRSDIATGVRDYAKQLGWALGLPYDLAQCIHRLWIEANKDEDEDGNETICFDEFAALVNGDGATSFALDMQDVKQMFYATDEDGNGVLTKDEFARFVSGNVNVLEVNIPEKADEDVVAQDQFLPPIA